MLVKFLAHVWSQHEIVLVLFVCITDTETFTRRVGKPGYNIGLNDLSPFTFLIFFNSKWRILCVAYSIIVIYALVCKSLRLQVHSILEEALNVFSQLILLEIHRHSCFQLLIKLVFILHNRVVKRSFGHRGRIHGRLTTLNSCNLDTVGGCRTSFTDRNHFLMLLRSFWFHLIRCSRFIIDWHIDFLLWLD